MNKDEKQIAAFLIKLGLTPIEFTKQDRRKMKTPDFKVFKNDQLIFYCEVKSIEEDTCVGFRKDPVYNRISKKILEAVQQFNSVNPYTDAPNFLAIVNHDKNCGSFDLRSVLTGCFLSEDGKDYPIFKNYSEGKIKDAKYKIDLYCWMDDFKPEKWIFNQQNKDHFLKLCDYFDKNPNSIKHI